jgi:DNA-directed RNA polymerase specialized sigma subunit
MSHEYLNNKSFETIIIKFQNAKRKQKRFEYLKQDIESQKQKASSKNTIKIHLKIENQEIADAHEDFISSQKILADAFYTLSKNIVRYAKFSNIDEDDAIQEGVLTCFERVEKFDPTKGKAFNYLTTCILNHFRQLWRTAKNYNELKKKYSKLFQIKNGLVIQGKKKEKKR